ncbi:MAG: hypothetical protein Q9227_004271 [Pyrenula ochraceoflavens]
MDDSAFTVSDNEIKAQEILLAATNHDLKALKRLVEAWPAELTEDGILAVNVQDPDTQFTPLHAAIAACQEGEPVRKENQDPEVPVKDLEREDDHNCAVNSCFSSAKDTVEYLLENGAQWEKLDSVLRTPGCIAWQLGDKGKDLYNTMVRAGTISVLLLNKLDADTDAEKEGFIELDSTDGEEELNDAAQNGTNGMASIEDGASEGGQKKSSEGKTNGLNGHHEDTSGLELKSQDPISNQQYISTPLTATETSLLDTHGNGIMMSWETSIMHRTADILLHTPGLRFLNVGFGMGIFDTYVQNHSNKPSEHHILEAHDTVLQRIRAEGWYEKPGVTIHEGRWQDVLPRLVMEGKSFDAVFFDTFAESYSEFRTFFSENLLGLLDSGDDARWSFFNGMGADRQIVYYVYQNVVDCELREAGYKATFEEMDVPREVLDDDKEWQGVRRKYWVIDRYRVPCVQWDND